MPSITAKLKSTWYCCQLLLIIQHSNDNWWYNTVRTPAQCCTWPPNFIRFVIVVNCYGLYNTILLLDYILLPSHLIRVSFFAADVAVYFLKISISLLYIPTNFNFTKKKIMSLHRICFLAEQSLSLPRPKHVTYICNHLLDSICIFSQVPCPTMEISNSPLYAVKVKK